MVTYNGTTISAISYNGTSLSEAWYNNGTNCCKVFPPQCSYVCFNSVPYICQLAWSSCSSGYYGSYNDICVCLPSVTYCNLDGSSKVCGFVSLGDPTGTAPDNTWFVCTFELTEGTTSCNFVFNPTRQSVTVGLRKPNEYICIKNSSCAFMTNTIFWSCSSTGQQYNRRQYMPSVLLGFWRDDGKKGLAQCAWNSADVRPMVSYNNINACLPVTFDLTYLSCIHCNAKDACVPLDSILQSHPSHSRFFTCVELC